MATDFADSCILIEEQMPSLEEKDYENNLMFVLETNEPLQIEVQ